MCRRRQSPTRLRGRSAPSTGGVKLRGSRHQPSRDLSTYESGPTSRLGSGACAHRVRVRGFGVYLYDPYSRSSATLMTSDFWIFVAIAVIVWGFLRLVGRGPPRHRRAVPRWYGAVEMFLGFAMLLLNGSWKPNGSHYSTLPPWCGSSVEAPSSACFSTWRSARSEGFEGSRALAAKLPKKNASDPTFVSALRAIASSQFKPAPSPLPHPAYPKL